MVITPTPSSQTSTALAVGLAKFIDASDPLLNLLKDARVGLQVFSLGLKSVGSGGAGIDEAKPVGWRVMVDDGTGHAAAAHVYEALANVAPKLTSVSRGPEIAAAIRIADGFKTLQEAEDQPYEARILRVPGVPIEVFWLKPQSGSGWVIPFLSLTEGIEAGRAYRTDSFLKKIQPIADKRLKFDDSAQAKLDT